MTTNLTRLPMNLASLTTTWPASTNLGCRPTGRPTTAPPRRRPPGAGRRSSPWWWWRSWPSWPGPARPSPSATGEAACPAKGDALKVEGTRISTAEYQRRIELLRALYDVRPPTEGPQVGRLQGRCRQGDGGGCPRRRGRGQAEAPGRRQDRARRPRPLHRPALPAGRPRPVHPGARHLRRLRGRRARRVPPAPRDPEPVPGPHRRRQGERGRHHQGLRAAEGPAGGPRPRAISGTSSWPTRPTPRRPSPGSRARSRSRP